MKTRKENIEYWCSHNGTHGILAHCPDGSGSKKLRFITERQIGITDVCKDSIHGLPADGRDMEGCYPYDDPCEVECWRSFETDERSGFKKLVYYWAEKTLALEMDAGFELGETADWKSDCTTERTKMLKRIDECRTAGTPCGVLRKDWDAVLRRYEKKGVDLCEIGGIAEEKGFDFEDLVAEVVSWYESGEDDEIKEDD